ncbi:unnamed protein product [Anisakis simplex]|uniref:Dauer Up-Regulated n=1 Tax=Anisakis simplex TaxID=6269 RepID=A0A0M3J0R4_ANISI|nr:unnamed protein product [Anisakis simplex]
MLKRCAIAIVLLASLVYARPAESESDNIFSNAFEATKTFLSDALDTVTGGAKEAGTVIGDAAGAAAGKVGEAAQTVGEGAKDAANTVGEGVKSAAGYVGDKAGEAKDSAGNALNSAKEGLQSAGAAVSDAAGNAASSVKQGASDVAEGAKGAAGMKLNFYSSFFGFLITVVIHMPPILTKQSVIHCKRIVNAFEMKCNRYKYTEQLNNCCIY